MVVTEVSPRVHRYPWTVVKQWRPPDIWILLQAFTGKHPLSECNPSSLVVMKIINGERPVYPRGSEQLGFSAQVWNMTVDCWRHDPVHRPTMAVVVEFLREWCVISPRRTGALANILFAVIPYKLKIRRCRHYLRGSRARTRAIRRSTGSSPQHSLMKTAVQPSRPGPPRTPVTRPLQPKITQQPTAQRSTPCSPVLGAVSEAHWTTRCPASLPPTPI